MDLRKGEVLFVKDNLLERYFMLVLKISIKIIVYEAKSRRHLFVSLPTSSPITTYPVGISRQFKFKYKCVCMCWVVGKEYKI